MRNRNLAPKSKSFLMGIGEGKCNIAFYIDTCFFFYIFGVINLCLLNQIVKE